MKEASTRDGPSIIPFSKLRSRSIFPVSYTASLLKRSEACETKACKVPGMLPRRRTRPRRCCRRDPHLPAAVEIVCAVGEQAQREGLCLKTSPESLRNAIICSKCAPVYPSYF